MLMTRLQSEESVFGTFCLRAPKQLSCASRSQTARLVVVEENVFSLLIHRLFSV
jgi:hypothetical protein